MDPLLLNLDLSRAASAADPYAFTWENEEYTRRFDDGQVSAAPLAWDGPVEELLAGIVELPPRADAVVRLGRTLRTFLAGVRWDVDEARLVAALAEGRPVVVTLRFAAAELYVLPWEALQVGPKALRLGNLPGVTVRYAWPGVEPPPSLGAAPRLLFAWSAAGGEVPHEGHLAGLVAGQPRDVFDPDGDVLADTSYRTFARTLRAAAEAGRPYTALHLLAHGVPVPDTATVGIALEGRVVDGDTLKQLLAEYAPSLRLVTVCACRGSDPGRLDTQLGSVAQELHRAGVASVIASRLPLSTGGSVDLAGAFYATPDLGDPVAVADAFRRARRALREGDVPSDADALQLYTAAPVWAARAPTATGTPPGPTPPAVTPVPVTAAAVPSQTTGRPPPPARPALPPDRALHELFLNMFSADELRRFLRYREGGDALLAELPTRGSYAELAEQAVEQADRRGLVDDAFFDALVAERPRRKAEIDAVRALWTPP